MTRQIALGLSLAAVFSVGTATVLVHHAAPATTKADEICIVLAKDAGHHHTQDYCIDWTSVAPH
jgi:predicted histidine transporter YuiF (NhaC family)